MEPELYKILARAALPGEKPPSLRKLLQAEKNPGKATRETLEYLELYPECRELIRSVLRRANRSA